MFRGSGAIEHDLLVFGNPGQPGQKFSVGYGTRQFQGPELVLVRIGAHQQGPALTDPGKNLLRRDPGHRIHDSSSLREILAGLGKDARYFPAGDPGFLPLLLWDF